MRVKFSELTEAFVQTVQTPLVYGGLQGQPGYASPTVAPQSITQPVYPMRPSAQTGTAPQLPSGKVSQSSDASQATSQAAQAAAAESGAKEAPEALATAPAPLPYPQTATQQMPQQSGQFGGTPKPQFVTAPSSPKPPKQEGAKEYKRSEYKYDQRPKSSQEWENLYDRRAAVEAAKKRWLDASFASDRAAKPWAYQGVQEQAIQFKPNSLKSLLNDAWDPKNPFGPMFPSTPKPKPVTPSGPYVPTPGGVKPKNPKVVTPPKPKQPTSLYKGLNTAILGGQTQKEVAQKTDSLTGSVGKAFDMIKDMAKGVGAVAATPPRELMAAATGRLGGLGYTNKGIQDRMDYYRSAIGMANPLSWLAGAMGKATKKSAEREDGVIKTGVLGGITDLASQWATATTDEPAKLMTAALYDPRALSKLQ